MGSRRPLRDVGYRLCFDCAAQDPRDFGSLSGVPIRHSMGHVGFPLRYQERNER
jgi:hypothetical protein